MFLDNENVSLYTISMRNVSIVKYVKSFNGERRKINLLTSNIFTHSRLNPIKAKFKS